MANATVHVSLVCILFGLITAQDVGDPPTGPTSPVKVNLSPVDGAYKGTLSVTGKDYNVHLKNPVDSVFASNFKFLMAEKDAQGHVQIKKVPISRDRLEMAERSLFVDEDSHAVFRVKHVMGKIQLHGHLENMHISHDAERHYAISHDASRNSDAINLNRTIIPDQRIESRQEVTRAEPKVLYVIDYKQWENLGEDEDRAMDYLTMFTRALNNRFATSSDPQISLKIVNALVSTGRGLQPFIEESKSEDRSDSYNILSVLEKYSKFMYKYREYVDTHALSPLLSGENFKYRNSNGDWVSIDGLSYIGGACLYNGEQRMSFMVSVTADQDAVWRGIPTMIHEISHNLNSPHDGQGDAKSCPSSDGYIMSRERSGTLNNLKFSECSKNSQKEYINSEHGTCLRENDGGSVWEDSSEDLGERFNLDQQCQMFTGRSDARRDIEPTNDEICRNLSCDYNDRCSDSDGECMWTVYFNTHPFDRTPCDEYGNVCINGYCTGG